MSTGDGSNNGNRSPSALSPLMAVPSSELLSPDTTTLRIPKNKSTGNLLSPQTSRNVDTGRIRFSFDAGSTQEINNLKRVTRGDHDLGFGTSGLRRIRRPGPLSRAQTFLLDESDFVPPSLAHSQTLPISRSASANYLMSGPASPVVEDLHRFPAESLHSFSFAKQSEDYLHSRQNILRKSVDFMRDRSIWATNPALADAQARVSGDVEIQGMMDLLRKANILPLETGERSVSGLGLGPLTGPADVEGRNVFEKTFAEAYSPVEEAIMSPDLEEGFSRRASQQEDRPPSPGIEFPRRPSSAAGSPTVPRRLGLKRTYTDLTSMSLQQKLIEALAQPFSSDEYSFPQNKSPSQVTGNLKLQAPSGTSAVHSHSSKWSPAAQAVFRTEGDAPWTISAANDLACLIFGVTRAEVRSLSILGIIQEDRRHWLEERLRRHDEPEQENPQQSVTKVIANGNNSLIGSRAGITARLLSKTPARVSKPAKRAQTDDGAGGYYRPKTKNHPPTKSRGVLLCGDIVPIQKRNGTRGSASFWVMEKRGGLIWVIEEITEDVAFLEYDNNFNIVSCSGDCDVIWNEPVAAGISLRMLLPECPFERLLSGQTGRYAKPFSGHFTARTVTGINIPTTVTKIAGASRLQVSSLPHIAGMMVLNPETLIITSSNSVFSAALFGYEQPDGLSICTLIPSFRDITSILTNEEGIDMIDGLVIPEHSFRRARALLALREGNENAASIFMRPSGLPAKHRDGSDIMVDVQMRVVRSETMFPVEDSVIEEKDESRAPSSVAVSELVFAVWITYSRQLHSASLGLTDADSSTNERSLTPPVQPEPPAHLPSPPPVSSDSSRRSGDSSEVSLIRQQITEEEEGIDAIQEPLEHPPPHVPYVPHEKKTIRDFIILEDMGSGAYGQVKLVRYRKHNSRKMVLKYVTKKRILVDTWTRDRRLGTVPLEIHVMDYLRRDGLRHPNIVEMVDFFEDDINYYIEMLPHGIPGMDLFDYIELRTNMEEGECRNIFKQVVDAIHHLHTKALVVHRDVKDENVVLDGEGRIKLIDFGSAAYIKNGPFDVFVGTIDYAAPEVLQGKAYGGKEQDVWALGILLYTIVYKENPFYNIDEILDHPLRVPFLPFSEECIDLIRGMLDRDVEQRLDIEQVQHHPWLIQE